MLDSRAKRYMKTLGTTPDLWILPEGVKIYLTAVRKENSVYFLKGPSGQAVYNSALTGGEGSAVDVANNCMIVEGKKFEIPGATEPIDPLFRRVTIGEYNTMFDTVSQFINGSKYMSHMRDIFVYDEDKVS
jgi:hypothetical protein